MKDGEMPEEDKPSLFLQRMWDILGEPLDKERFLRAYRGEIATEENPAIVRAGPEQFDAAVASLKELPPGLQRRIKVVLKEPGSDTDDDWGATFVGVCLNAAVAGSFLHRVSDMMSVPLDEEMVKQTAASVTRGEMATVHFPAVVRAGPEQFDAAVAVLNELPPAMQRRVRVVLKEPESDGDDDWDDDDWKGGWDR